MYILDSSALIEVIQERPKSEKVLQIIKDDPIITTTISMHELLSGAVSEKERFILEGLFSKFIILEHDIKAALIGSKIEKELTRTGNKINTLDVLIAGIAESKNAEIVTLDKDFSKIKSVKSKVIT